MSDDQAHIKSRWQKLAETASTIIPSKVVGEPNLADARCLVSDLRILARDVDALIEAYGRYAVYALGMSQSDFVDNFINTLSGALDGNALFCIEGAAEDYEMTLADRAADHKREIRAAE